MKNFVKYQFTHNGKNYETRVTKYLNFFEVRVYLGDKVANGYSYRLDSTNPESFNWDPNSEACQRLLTIAESDVKNDIWKGVITARAKK